MTPLRRTPLPCGYDLRTAVISESTSGSKTIVAAIPNRKIKVYAYTIVVGGAVNLTWYSDSTVISGTMEFGNKAEGLCPSTLPPYFLLKTKRGGALILNLSADEGVAGHVSYWVQ